MDNLYDLVLGGIKQGIIEGYKKYIQLFTDDFQFWRNLAAQEKATEYFLTVHTAERLYEECREHSVTICPEMLYEEIFRQSYVDNTSDLFKWNPVPPKVKDKRRADLAIIQELSGVRRVKYVVEIKSINQSRARIKQDVSKLHDIINQYETNTIESVFAVYLKQKKDTKIDSNDFLNEERDKIEKLIRKSNILSNDLNLKVTPFPVLIQDGEFVQEDEEAEAWDESRAIELYGFIVEISKKSK